MNGLIARAVCQTTTITYFHLGSSSSESPRGHTQKQSPGRFRGSSGKGDIKVLPASYHKYDRSQRPSHLTEKMIQKQTPDFQQFDKHVVTKSTSITDKWHDDRLFSFLHLMLWNI
eukprot:3321583-Amphidinium_carterae.1